MPLPQAQKPPPKKTPGNPTLEAEGGKAVATAARGGEIEGGATLERLRGRLRLRVKAKASGRWGLSLFRHTWGKGERQRAGRARKDTKLLYLGHEKKVNTL